MQDQYINHIMNETGATVSLRGRGSGNPDPSHCDGILFSLQYLFDSLRCLMFIWRQ